MHVTSCGQQDPAFKEDVSTANIDSANATARRSTENRGENTQNQTNAEGNGAIVSVIPPESDNRSAQQASIEDAIRSAGYGDVLRGIPGREGPPVINPTPSVPVSQDDSPFIPGPLPSNTNPSGSAGSGNPTGGGNTTGTGNASGFEGGVGTEGSLSLKWRVVEFTQKGPGKVDLLWVVDTSGSMSEEQAYLATNFNRMIMGLNAAGHDFQTAITTTDVCQEIVPLALDQRVCPANYGGSTSTHLQGSFLGTKDRQVLKKSDTDLIEKFNTYTKAGVNGSGFEHGLYAAKLAIDKVKSGENGALLRPDAFLAVIVVSDEEDDGIGLSKIDAYNGHNFVAEGLTSFKFTDDDMISYLQGVKSQGNFSISAIAPTKNPDGTMCSAPHTAPLEEGTQYIKAAQKSGGLLQSLCDTDWSQSLATLGVDLNAQITQINLPSKPELNTIKVMAN